MSLTHWDWFLNVLYVFMSVFSWISIRCYQVWVTGVLVVWILEPLGYEIDVLRRLAALRVLRLGRLARAVRIMPMFHESPGNWRWRWIQHQKISHTQLQNTSICMRITYDNHVRMLPHYGTCILQPICLRSCRGRKENDVRSKSLPRAWVPDVFVWKIGDSH